MNARRARRQRQAEHRRLEHLLDRAHREPPRLVGVMPDGPEAWMSAGVMFVVPAIRDDDPPEVKDAIERRRRATLSGTCDCGARRHVARGRVVFEHEDACTASDQALQQVATRHGLSLVRWAS